SLTIYLLFDNLVAKRLNFLARQMDGYPEYGLLKKPGYVETKDEIGALSGNFRTLCQRLEQSQLELDEARKQVFQSEKQAALGRLVAGISHEINNPLGGMQNCIQTMQRSMDQPQLLNRYLELLGQGVERIKGTVQQLLNIGRKEPLILQRGDIDQMMRDCLELCCVGQDQIELDLDLKIDRPLLIGLEALRQVIINLAGNAVQAMAEQGGGALRVASQCQDGRLCIRIADSGPGIAPKHLDKIFEPFFTTKQVGEGTGLGLSVSFSLIKQMNGELSAGNSAEGGALFSIKIPLHPDDCAPSSGQKEG
ncbi:MAG: ATP-binding protein, partial [Desulfuromonadales bacterium]|nr:ATP-binding protein [Desulfuromonadales bacterium]